MLQETTIHDSAPPTLNTKGRGYGVAKEAPIELSDCFDAFTVTEKLTEANAWYCRKCKEHRCVTRRPSFCCGRGVQGAQVGHVVVLLHSDAGGEVYVKF